MSSIAVAILNYNGEKLLTQFLPSVVKYTTIGTVYVIDNCSTDGSLELLRTKFQSVRVVTLDQNYGFCGGYNRGLGQITTPYYVLINSDVEVTPGWLEPLHALMESDPSIAAIQPKILSYNERQKFEYAGAGGAFIDSLGYPFCRGRLFDHIEEDHGQYNDTREVFWASGACMMIRSSVYHKFEGLDEDLFAHMEEIDLCWKINRTSHRVFYCGQSTVYHLGAGTLGYESPRKTYLNFRNGLTLLFKHLESVELFYKLPFRFMLDWLAALVFVLYGKTKNASSIFKAHADFFSALSEHRRKRKKIQSQFPGYRRDNIYSGSIVAAYFLKGKRALSVNNPK